MRTTMDLPDDLYRSLKARAALSGVTMRELIKQLIEQGLRSSERANPSSLSKAPPPVIIPSRGITIPALSRDEILFINDNEDEMKNARFT